jgi:hypothetical protein
MIGVMKMELNLYTTDELEKHINCVYSKLKPITENDEVYTRLNINFAEMPQRTEGISCYATEDSYHYRYVERGVIQRHDITQNLLEITYWAIEPKIFSMAVHYERKHRINNQDSRRIIFQKELQFFEALGDNYREKAKSEINKILKTHPFQDELYE